MHSKRKLQTKTDSTFEEENHSNFTSDSKIESSHFLRRPQLIIFFNELSHRYSQPPYFGSHCTFGLRSGILKVLLLNIAHCSPLNAKKIRLDSVKQRFVVYKHSSPKIWSARRAFVRRTTPYSYAVSSAIFSSV